MNFYNPYHQQMYTPPMGQLEQLRQQQFQPQNFQHPQFQQQFQTPQQTNIIWVRSEDEAKNYLVAPNSSVTMWNENLPEIYLKKADSSGRPEFEVYSLVKRTAPISVENKPDDEVITLKKLMVVLTNLGLIQVKTADKEESENG